MNGQEWVEYRGPVPVRHVVNHPRKHGACGAVLGEAVHLGTARDRFVGRRCGSCRRKVNRISFPVRIAPGSPDWAWAQARMAEAQA
jgi:hypothetical protein